MPLLSAGLLVYRDDGPGRAVTVLLVHPGGPYWRGKDAGAWSIPKGEVGAGETPAEVAAREFGEELGLRPPQGPWHDLGEIVQAGGKRVRAWAVRGDLDLAATRSNLFEMEWPPRSGRLRKFPEVDRAEWTTLPDARRRLVGAQVELVDRLEQALITPSG